MRLAKRIAALVLLAVFLNACTSRGDVHPAIGILLLPPLLIIAAVTAIGRSGDGPKEASQYEPEDPEEAKKRYELAQKEAAKAFKKRSALASCGQPEEQYWLGVMYKAGTEPAKEDPVAAYKWVSLAAQSGHASAKTMKPPYAKVLTPGELAEAERMVAEWMPDPESCEQYTNEKAFQERLALASCGEPEEQYLLGVMYKGGVEPAKQDHVVAYKWVSLAARSGHAPGVTMKPTYAKALTPDQLAEADRMVVEWKPDPKACKDSPAPDSGSTS